MNSGLKLRFVAVIVMCSLTAASYPQAGYSSDYPQFLFREFSPGKIIMKAGGSENSELNYNMVSGKMVFMRDGKPYDMLSAILIDTVYLQNCTFVRINDSFFELLLNAPLTLLLQHKGTLAPAGKPSGYGTTSNTSSITSVSAIDDNYKYYNLKLPPEFKVTREEIYWIRKTNGELESFTNQRQFMNLFPGYSEQLKAHIKAGKIKFDRKEEVAELVRFCNEIMK